jgi:MFS transporter, ACS family, hexuronate transporter
VRARWLVLGVFALSGLLNYLDRQILPALAPVLRHEFHLNNADYGLILAAFSLTYAFAAPFAGLFIDRVGLNRGIGIALAVWSLAGMATGFAGSLGVLVGCRAALGLAQAGGVPASGKAIATFLYPEERALGNALSQIGLGLGAMAAPPLAIWIATHYGWRMAFVATGAAGLLWIPLWKAVAHSAPRKELPGTKPGMDALGLLREPQMWAFIAANILSMTVYTLWSNWTTVYLVQARGIPVERTGGLAAIPPLFFNLGGLAGGWMSLRWMRGGLAPAPARLRACLLSALAMLVTAAVPLMPSASWAVGIICLSAFFASAMSVNLYSMPLDAYGAARAAFAISLLTGAYGLMQTGFSPAAGWMIDRYGFAPVCVLVSVLPMLGWVLLRQSQRPA